MASRLRSFAFSIVALATATIACVALAASPSASPFVPAHFEGDPVDVHASKMDVDLAKRTAELDGDVTLSRSDLQVRCQHVEARYDDAPKVTWARASGGVSVDAKGTHAEARDAEIDLAKRVVTLQGSVVVTRAGARLTAESASLDLASMRVSMSSVHGVISSPAASSSAAP